MDLSESVRVKNMELNARRRSSVLRSKNGTRHIRTDEPKIVTTLTEEITIEEEEPPKKNWWLATVVLLLEVTLAICEAQFTSIGFTNHNFTAPHFYTECRFISRSLAFPLVIVIVLVMNIFSTKKKNLQLFFRKCASISGKEGLTVKNFFKKYTLPTLTTAGTGATYIVALIYIPPTVTSACYTSCVAISYVLSLVFLKQKHFIFKKLSGSYALHIKELKLYSFCRLYSCVCPLPEWPWWHTPQQPASKFAVMRMYIGVIVIIISCFLLSFHQLFYVKSFPDADPYQAAFTCTIMFATAALLYWPVPLALRLQEQEVWEWSTVPWPYVFGGMFASLGVAFLYAFCLAISSPFFISLGELLNLCVTGLVDYFLRDIPLFPLQIVGSALIGVAFIALLIPDRFISLDLKRFKYVSKKTLVTHPPLHTTDSVVAIVERSESLASVGEAQT
ncbi:uncharacterized protein LOC129599471 [Paramacrobiotus metropolitanus]|uniref:uncharacterized protein LOC129599471 n=1 Tax=Paramacrobiotus metropolitanus TaxID=2943436 RepID=UPI00244589F6|nr:uncharacterized protein LOC129599471 [Paramacrobiotus metropolitanus]